MSVLLPGVGEPDASVARVVRRASVAVRETMMDGTGGWVAIRKVVKKVAR
jgi:hypothetical protein